MITEQEKIYYVVTIDGRPVSTERHESQMLAEMAKSNLPEDQKPLAEITQVAENGQQVLLG